jgi:membrane protease YdiL (CAAX protease family)
MNDLESKLTSRPFTFTMLLVFSSILALVVSSPSDPVNLINKDLIHSAVQVLLVALMLFIIAKIGWMRKTTLIVDISSLSFMRFFAIIPMLLLAAIMISSTDFSVLTFSIERSILLLFVNFSTAAFEEILLRGLCFAIFYQAWNNTPNAIIKAAFAQAIIFGLAHSVNIMILDPLFVLAQMVYATFFGLGFAGLLVYTKTIWAPILVHTVINSTSGIAQYFNLNFINSDPELAMFVSAIVVSFIFSAVPGIFLLYKAQKNSQL